ncbi:MAG: phosphoribosylglycinamide formyltransferase [Saprospirales bacterium]|nr:phosphoribosylglycinamide formyltransferase [Saprospirales bacterium]MBK8489627.1 phosphoribosylglycinamide formyltransferase [Saprospirales bacterium]
MVHIAIFASGTGTNARKIMEYFASSPEVRIALVISNRKDAFVLQIAEEKGIPTLLINKESFYESHALLAALREYSISMIVLAGFLWLIPGYLVKAFEHRILNIHPALLPKFGGKGMYGHHVHEAVLASGEKESGITIHLVDERYDHGSNIFQARCPVEATDTPDTVAKKVQQLEHHYYPQVIDEYIREKLPFLLHKTNQS